jgi:tetratricopeptide (TPR) repeat protein/tRNA A-37 threonylcarbamoyl transferase component Bud32
MSDPTTTLPTDLDAHTRVEPSAPTTDPAGRSAARVAPGERIGRYLVLDTLGEGGMAIVYAAYDIELDRKVAIKVLRADAYGDQQSVGLARLQREAQSMARLNHPNIAQVYDVGPLRKGVFIAMELIQGDNLRTWLTRQPRTWRAVVDVFLQAGEGLAAAHAAGIIHRDFKPDNVLVGDDGRVRVLDFGLARPGDPDKSPEPEAVRRALDSDVRREALLTQAGTYMGTPAYMAPEQQMMQAADARSDQFAFCVALYEGLHGARPFPGKTAAELRRQIVLGRISPPPRDSTAPEWLRAVVLRGLSTEPAGRFPSMTALLTALRRDPSERRRKWMLVGAAGLVVSGLLGALVVLRSTGPGCARVDDDLAGVWDDARRDEVRAAFAATGVPFSAQALASVERGLFVFAGAWTRQARARCEANLSAASADVASAADELGELCLERRRVELRALVDVLARADATTVEHASAAVDRLRDPDLCADPRALASELASAPLPADRTIAAAVFALRERLAEVRFLELAGRYDEGLARAAPLVDDARRLGDPPALAEALLQRAVLLGRKADYPEADEALMAALAEAERAGYHALRAEAMVHRIELVGFHQAKPERVAEWIAPTLALVRHVAADGALEGRLLANIGLVRYRQGNFAAAVEAQEQALALLGRALKETDPEFVRALLDLGRSYHRSGRRVEALQTLRRAHATAIRALGPDHPLLIGIYLNLANVGAGPGDLLYRRSIELSERTFGPDHPSGASAIANLGNTYNNYGHPEQALALYVRAVDIYRRTIGDHPTTAFNLVNVAAAAMTLGRDAQALAALRESVAIFEKSYGGVEHPDMIGALMLLGHLTRKLGHPGESRDLLMRGLAIARAAQNPMITPEAFAIELAETLLAAGDPRGALDLLDPLADRFAGEPDAARRDLLRARALWLAEPAARPRAHELAESAERGYAALAADDSLLPPVRAEHRAALAATRTWLSDHAFYGMARSTSP